MFVVHEARLDVPLSAAQARLSNLIRGSRLIKASEDAYGAGITSLLRVGPVGSAPGLSRLVHARFGDLVTQGEVVTLRLRWEATGPGDRLFPALDADVTLTAAGEQATVLRVDGAYRPPLGALGAGLDRAVLHRVATATIQSFVHRVADAIVHPAPAMRQDHGDWEWELPYPAPEGEDIWGTDHCSDQACLGSTGRCLNSAHRPWDAYRA
jgi:hypothetical protein